MKACTRKYFRNGVNNQKRADIVIEFKRPDNNKMKLWTEEQKSEAREFAVESLRSFKDFVAEIIAQ